MCVWSVCYCLKEHMLIVVSAYAFALQGPHNWSCCIVICCAFVHLTFLQSLAVPLPFDIPSTTDRLQRSTHSALTAPCPPPPTPVSSWVLTCTGPLILVTANTLLNDQLLSQGPHPQGPTDSKGHPSVFQYWLSGPVNVALGLTESEHCH